MARLDLVTPALSARHCAAKVGLTRRSPANRVPNTPLALAIGCVLFAASCVLLAQTTGQQYQLNGQVQASGGQPANGDNFRINATIGQSNVMPQSAMGTQFQINAGFWVGNRVPPPTSETIFFSGFESP